jgi:cytochrome P450
MSVQVSSLPAQLRKLLDEAEAHPEKVPGGILAWWGPTDFPDGSSSDPPVLSQQQWEGLYFLLENGAREDETVTPLPYVRARTRDLRPDGPLPIAIASFRLAAPRPDLLQQVRDAAASGKQLNDPPPDLSSAIEERHAFIASGLLAEQWEKRTPVYRGRRVEFVVDKRFHFTNPDGPLPDEMEVDAGDGQGARPVEFGVPFEAEYGEADQATVTIRCRYGQASRTARFTVAISDQPAPPAPDEMWRLVARAGDGRPGNTGRAYVFRAPGRAEIRDPVILVEGFPGGRPYTYMYEVLNARGTLDGLRAAGYDVIFVGLDNGADKVQRNADVLVECIRQATLRTPAPLVVGGFSLGGLVSRYALALMEARGEAHNTRVFLSIDTPHGGAYTSLGVQWFVKSLVGAFPALRGFQQLIDSPGNQQMMLSWLDENGKAGVSNLRKELLSHFEQIGGYPKQPRKLAVSCGRGDGEGNASPGVPTLTWDGQPFVSVKLNTLPGVDDVMAEGSWHLDDPPQLEPLTIGPRAVAWESAPGGQNDYNGQVAEIVRAFGCGRMEDRFDTTCSVPTVSALGLAQGPFEQVPPASPGAGPFDAYVCSKKNLQHLTISKEVSKWLLENLGPAPSAGKKGAPSAFAKKPDFDPAKFEPHDRSFLADPYPAYAYFRDNAPVSLVQGYPNPWVFGYDNVKGVLDDKETFVKNSPQGPTPPPGPAGAMAFFPEGLFSSDPPRHDELRAILEPLFYKAITQAGDLVSEFADACLQNAKQTGRIELVYDYALPVPSNVLFTILGIPGDPVVRGGLIRWITAYVMAHDRTQQPAVREVGATCGMALNTYVDGLIHQNIEKRQPGLIGDLCDAVGGKFTRDDVQACCVDFMVAGYLSTTFLICTGIRSLLANPEQLRALRADHELIKPAVEEMLRFDAPAQIVDRVARTDTELCGVPLKAGTTVSAILGSADRDPAVFPKPDEFRISRDNEAQISFGWGIHHCIGAPLVRLWAPPAILKLVDLPDLAVDGLPQWQTDPYLRGMVNLPLSFSV